MRAAGRRPAPEPLEPAEEDEILQAREPQVERAIARRHRPDAGTERPPAARRVATGHADVAAVGLDEPGQDTEECRLAGAVRSQERMDLAAADDEGDPVERDDPAEAA